MAQVNGEITDEMLMAYADGEASPAEAARVEAALGDPKMEARLALFDGTRRLSAEAFPPQPVPDALRARIEAMVATGGRPANDARPAVETAGNVVALRQPATAAPRRQAFMAMAASVLGLAIGVGAFFAGAEFGSPATPAGGPGVAQLAGLPLDGALAAPSDTTTNLDGTALRTVASFRGAGGELCREFAVEAERTVSGVACRREGAWEVDFAVASLPDAGGYAPASGNEALDAYLSGIDAGAPLDAAAEGEALAALR